jgi:hypothetical protein
VAVINLIVGVGAGWPLMLRLQAGAKKRRVRARVYKGKREIFFIHLNCTNFPANGMRSLCRLAGW